MGRWQAGSILFIVCTTVGCASSSSYAPVARERLAVAFPEVMRAEAERMRTDSPEFQLRKQARDEYQKGTRALAASDYRAAALWFARAEADAELALALSRQRAWSEEARRSLSRLGEARGSEDGGIR